MSDTIDINVTQTTETVDITITPNLTTINVNSILGGGLVTSVNGEIGDVIVPNYWTKTGNDITNNNTGKTFIGGTALDLGYRNLVNGGYIYGHYLSADIFGNDSSELQITTNRSANGVPAKFQSNQLIKYDTDKSANYDSRTLIDKGYADATYATISTGAGITNLSVTPSATNVIINSSIGTGATISLGNGTNAGVTSNDYTTVEKTKVSNLSGTNTGDNASNTNYASDYRASNFVAGTNYLTPIGSAAGLTSFPTLNQNTTGTAYTITGNISESQVTNLVTDLGLKAPLASPTFTGTVTSPLFVKTGGTSSQFLKADGSVDSSTYLTSVPAQSFASLTGKPTTLLGYGITDAYPLSGNPSGFISTVNGTSITPSSTNGVSATIMAYNDATSSIQTQLNSKQTVLTNPITGTGTTNFLPKFTGTSALGNSLIQDNGTSITIVSGFNGSITNGTLTVQNTNAYATPYTQYSQVWLDAVGGSLASLRNDGTLIVSNTITTNYFGSNSGGSVILPAFRYGTTGIYFPSAGIISFGNSGTESLRVPSTGNLLLNQTTDDGINKLQVTGGAKITEILLAGSGSLAGSALNIAQTWNTIGTPTAIKLNVTNTASGVSSKLIDLQNNAVSKFNVTSTGTITTTKLLLNQTTDLGASLQVTGASLQNGNIFFAQPTPTALTATGTLTIAQILTGLETVTSATAVSLTLPTGTLTDAGILGGLLPVQNAFEWTIINLGSSAGIVTLVAGTGHTIVGLATIPILSQGTFRTTKTATNTFVTYRVY